MPKKIINLSETWKKNISLALIGRSRSYGETMDIKKLVHLAKSETGYNPKFTSQHVTRVTDALVDKGVAPSHSVHQLLKKEHVIK